jgi:hypothetical protein
MFEKGEEHPESGRRGNTTPAMHTPPPYLPSGRLHSFPTTILPHYNPLRHACIRPCWPPSCMGVMHATGLATRFPPLPSSILHIAFTTSSVLRSLLAHHIPLAATVTLSFYATGPACSSSYGPIAQCTNPLALIANCPQVHRWQGPEEAAYVSIASVPCIG